MRLKAIYDLSDKPFSNEAIRANECYFELLSADIYDKLQIGGIITVVGTGIADQKIPITEKNTILEVKEYLNNIDKLSCQYDAVNNLLILKLLSAYNRTITMSEHLAKNLGLKTKIELKANGQVEKGKFAPRGIRYITLKSEDIAMTDTQAAGLDTKTLCIFTPGNNFSYVNYNVADQIPIVSNKTMRFSLIDNFGNTLTDYKCCIEFIIDTVRRHEKTSGYFRIGQRYRMPKDITRVALAEVVPLARATILTEDMLDYYVITYNYYKQDQQPGIEHHPLYKYKMTSAERCTLVDYDAIYNAVGKPITKSLFKDIMDALTLSAGSTLFVAGYNEKNNMYCITLKHKNEDWLKEWTLCAEQIDIPKEEIEAKAKESKTRAAVIKDNVMLYFPPWSILSLMTPPTRKVMLSEGKRYILLGWIVPDDIFVDGYQVPNFHPYLPVGSFDQYIGADSDSGNSGIGRITNFPSYEDRLDLYVNDNPICRLNYENGLLQQKNVAYFEMIDIYPTIMLQTSLQTRTRQSKDANDCFIKLFLK